MVNTPLEAVKAARAQHTNIVGTCQATVRTWLDAPSAGDFDGDGAADAEDGWKTEPISARHFDEKGSPGHPAAFLGGSHDNGHRALFVEPFILRSTDFDSATKRYSPGVVGEGTVREVAQAMGVLYAGWSDTIDGEVIPAQPMTRGWRVDAAIIKIRRARNHAKNGSARKAALQKTLDLLVKLPQRPKG